MRVPGRVSSKGVPRGVVPAPSRKAWQVMEEVGMETPEAPLTERVKPGWEAGGGLVG